MKRVYIMTLVVSACSNASAVQMPLPHCVNEMVAMYTLRGAPDSVMVEAWRIDSTGQRTSEGPGLHYYEGWFYGATVAAFSWGGTRRTCDHSTFQR